MKKLTKDEQEVLFITGGLLIAGGLAYFLFKNIGGYNYSGEIWDSYTIQRLNNLHPGIRQEATNFILAAQNEGYPLRVTDTYRSFQDQAITYAQGRTLPGNIVTYAQPGESYHNYALALDVVEIDANGQPLWDNPNWTIIGQIGKDHGFKWGGDFKNFKDWGHFESHKYGEWPALLAAYTAGNVDSQGFINVT